MATRPEAAQDAILEVIRRMRDGEPAPQGGGVAFARSPLAVERELASAGDPSGDPAVAFVRQPLTGDDYPLWDGTQDDSRPAPLVAAAGGDPRQLRPTPGLSTEARMRALRAALVRGR